MYEYRAKATRVIDGDTFEADIDLGFHVHVHATLRLDGIDAPELHDKDPATSDRARHAADRLRDLLLLAIPLPLNNPRSIVIRTRPDIRGDDRVDTLGRRYLAQVWAAVGPLGPEAAIDVNATLLAEGLAKPWRPK